MELMGTVEGSVTSAESVIDRQSSTVVKAKAQLKSTGYKWNPIRFCLNSSNRAGAILEHCIANIDEILAGTVPTVYKIGITRDPHRRWHHETYGYGNDIEGWQQMRVVARTKGGEAIDILEAALIRIYDERMMRHCKLGWSILFVCGIQKVRLANTIPYLELLSHGAA